MKVFARDASVNKILIFVNCQVVIMARIRSTDPGQAALAFYALHATALALT